MGDWILRLATRAAQRGATAYFDRLTELLAANGVPRHVTEACMYEAEKVPPIYARVLDLCRRSQTSAHLIDLLLEPYQKRANDEVERVWEEKQEKRRRYLMDELHPLLRARVLQEEPICVYCKRHPATQVDHIRPRCQGGDNRRSNLAGSCATCNRSKGKHTPKQWKKRLQERIEQSQADLNHAYIVLEASP